MPMPVDPPIPALPPNFDIKVLVAEVSGDLVDTVNREIQAQVTAKAAQDNYAQVVTDTDALVLIALTAKLTAEANMVTSQELLAAEVNYIQELIGGDKNAVDPTPPPLPPPPPPSQAHAPKPATPPAAVLPVAPINKPAPH